MTERRRRKGSSESRVACRTPGALRHADVATDDVTGIATDIAMAFAGARRRRSWIPHPMRPGGQRGDPKSKSSKEVRS